MNASERYQQLIDEGLIVPIPEPSAHFKFPTLLIHVPTITTSGVIDPEARRVAADAELERNSKRG